MGKSGAWVPKVKLLRSLLMSARIFAARALTEIRRLARVFVLNKSLAANKGVRWEKN
jgi:hypothetical protein